MSALALIVRGLSISVRLSKAHGPGPERERLRLVHEVSFELWAGRTVALVGESGAGKSLTGLALLGLVPPGCTMTGSIVLNDQELVGADSESWRALRGNRVAMVFQEPATALNPALTIGDQVSEPLQVHGGMRRQQAKERAAALLGEVGISAVTAKLSAYPFELSGGERQRAVIAMALACDPEVLILDEPTSALDVSTQAQLLVLLRRLVQSRKLAALFIIHDLALVPAVADDVLVMHAGTIVERLAADGLPLSATHPHTRDLLAAARRLDEQGGCTGA